MSHDQYWAMQDAILDCNDNNRADSADLFEGSSTDFDCDQIPDECESAAEVIAATKDRPIIGVWVRPDTSATSIRIRYAVPDTARFAMIEISNPDSTEVRHLAVPSKPPAGFLRWDLRDDHGHRVQSTSFRVRIHLDTYQCETRVNLWPH